MTKFQTYYGGSTLFDDNFKNNKTNPPTIPKNYILFDKTGIDIETNTNSNLHLVASDLSVGSDWVSRIGSVTAQLHGAPNIGLKTGLYPYGKFDGIDYKKGVSFPDVTDYYTIPYSANNVLDTSNDMTMEFVIQTGRCGVGLVFDEVLIHTQGSLMNNNFTMFMINSGLYPLFMTVVNFDVTPIVLSKQLDKHSHYFMTLVWEGATKTLSHYMNGVFQSSMSGVGNIDTVAPGTPTYLGIDAFVLSPTRTSKIIEFHRQSTQKTATEVKQSFFGYAGLKSKNGEFPDYFINGSRQSVFIANDIITFGENWPRINDKGYLSENANGSLLVNNFFSEDMTPFSNWTITAVAGSSVTSYTDQDSFKTIGGNGASLFTDGVMSTCSISQSSPIIGPFYGALYPVCIEIWTKSIDAGAIPLLHVQNATTGNYYDFLTQTWVPADSFVEVGVGLTSRNRYLFNITNEAFNSALIFTISSHENPANANKSFIIYGINDSVGYYPGSVSPNFDELRNHAANIMYYPKSIIDMTLGNITSEVTFLGSSSTPPLAIFSRYLLSCSSGFFFSSLGSNDLSVYNSGAENCALITPSYNENETMKFNLLWDSVTSKTMSLNNISKNQLSISTCNFDIDDNLDYFYIGVDRFFNNQMDAYIKNIYFY